MIKKSSPGDTDLIHLEIIDRSGHKTDIMVPDGLGLSVMESCVAFGLPVQPVCGGMALCGGCHVYILSEHALPPISEQEDETLEKLPAVKAASRLCCQIPVRKHMHGLRLQLAPTT